MMTLLAKTTDDLATFCALPGSYPLTPTEVMLHGADAHWVVQGEGDGRPLARASLWWRNVPPYPAQASSHWLPPPPGALGLIGHYAAHADAAAQLLLEQACAELARQGCTVAVGPLDGSTFRHYRFVTERALGGAAAPRFFLEPDNPDAWPAHFGQCGFMPLAHYFSAHGELPRADPRLTAQVNRLTEAGIAVRPADLTHFRAELLRIYALVIQSFAANFLYTPISQDEFLAQYAAVQPYVQPQFVLIAEQHGEPVGFLFALPDLAQAQRGAAVDTLIIKTVGVAPELAGVGLGGLLVAQVQEAARQQGYRHVIHALMFEDNISRKISQRYAQVMRRYTLLGRPLT